MTTTDFNYKLRQLVWVRKRNRLLLGRIIAREEQTRSYSVSTDEGLYVVKERDIFTREEVIDQICIMEHEYAY